MEETANQKTFRSYQYFWAGQLFSLLGSLVVFFVINVWITDVTGSALMLSLANFMYLIPLLIVTPFAGVISDRYDRKRIILIVDSVLAFLTAILAILFLFNFTELWIVFILIGLRSTCQGFHQPTVSAIIPSMVPKHKLSRMNGIRYFFLGIVQLAGPAAGAVLLFLFPIKIVLWIDVITYFIALVPLLAIKIPKVNITSNQSGKNSFFREIGEGFKTIKKIPGLLIIMIIAMLLYLTTTPLFTLAPFFIKIVHGGNNFLLAIIEMILQGGMILGALVPTFKKQWKNEMKVFFIGLVILNLGYLVQAIAPIGFYPMIGSGAFILGFTLPLVDIIILTVVQRTIPPDKMGRVSSIMETLMMIATPLGTIILGPLSIIIPVPLIYMICAIAGIIISIIPYYFTDIRHIDYNTVNFKSRDIENLLN